MGNKVSYFKYEQLLNKLIEHEKLYKRAANLQPPPRIDSRHFENKSKEEKQQYRKKMAEKYSKFNKAEKEERLLKKSIVASIKQFRDEMKEDRKKFDEEGGRKTGKLPARVLQRNKYKLLREQASTINKYYGIKYNVPSFATFAKKSKKTKS